MTELRPRASSFVAPLRNLGADRRSTFMLVRLARSTVKQIARPGIHLQLVLATDVLPSTERRRSE